MPRIGLALGGGGSRGAYQIGVARALEQIGILARVEAFAGTSIGAVNAVMLATMSPAAALALWLESSQDEIRATEGTFRRIIKEGPAILDKGIYTIAPLERRLRTHLDADKLATKEVYVTVSRGGAADESIVGLMRSVVRHFRGKEQNLLYCPLAGEPLDEAVNLVLASCAIPIVFPPVVEGERKYVDGGLYDNIPVRPLADAGCDIVIAVHLFAHETIDHRRFPGVRILELHPSGPLGSVLNFDPAKTDKHQRLGFEDALRFFSHESIAA